INDIRNDLEGFGVKFDRWYSERSLVESGAVERATETLQNAGHIYKEKGALWFRSSDFGDEKDRVVYRDNGMHTYFASDIAYHMEKFERGFEHVIDVWGADHHGYVPRVKAAIQALGENPDKFEALLVQFAILYRGSERVQMSTRSGSFVTLRELREEVGADAARFFYVMRKCEQHMDFDLDLAKSQSNDNPVYYIQYAHARVCSVMQQLSDKGLSFDQANGLGHLNLLVEPQEQALVTTLAKFPEMLQSAAVNREPHAVAHYLRDLANELHSYYNAHHFIVDDANLRDARLALAIAVRQVIRNGLKLLGVSAPERMTREEDA
ncbi:MAG: arginine--tRNA ligase, partial [Chromatiales bacterium]|nr:arginine--tRNA ligase [Chromatiales bacterium]